MRGSSAGCHARKHIFIWPCAICICPPGTLLATVQTRSFFSDNCTFNMCPVVQITALISFNKFFFVQCLDALLLFICFCLFEHVYKYKKRIFLKLRYTVFPKNDKTCISSIYTYIYLPVFLT